MHTTTPAEVVGTQQHQPRSRAYNSTSQDRGHTIAPLKVGGSQDTRHLSRSRAHKTPLRSPAGSRAHSSLCEVWGAAGTDEHLQQRRLGVVHRPRHDGSFKGVVVVEFARLDGRKQRRANGCVLIQQPLALRQLGYPLRSNHSQIAVCSIQPPLALNQLGYPLGRFRSSNGQTAVC